MLKGYTGSSADKAPEGEISRSGDKQEKEARGLANQVMQSPGREGQAEPERHGGDSGAGGGQPLSGADRDFFQSRFQQDFSHVRVHTGQDAARSASAVNAKAYTSGSDIVFNRDQYNPETSSTRSLLAHELTHVVQQTAQAPSGAAVFPSSHPLYSHSPSASSARPVIAREPKEEQALTTRIVRAKTDEDTAVILWLQDGSIVALLEFVDNIALDEYLAGNVTQDKLIKDKRAVYVNLGISMTVTITPGNDGTYDIVPPTEPVTGTKAPEPGKTTPQPERQKKGKSGVKKPPSQSKQMQDIARLQAQPDKVKKLFGGDKAIKPSNTDKLIRILDLYNSLTPEEKELFQLLVTHITGDLELVEKSLEEFIRAKDRMRKQLEEEAQKRKDKKKKTLNEKLSDTWIGFESGKLGTMDRGQKETLARQQAAKQTRVHLRHMVENPGETAIGMAEGMVRVDKLAEQIADDVREAADGNNSGFSRWAGVMGGSSKYIGWLAGVAGIVYVALLFVPGVNIAELAIAALVGGVAAVALSGIEAELRIQAAADAKTPEEFKEQTEKAAAARVNAIVGGTLMVAGLVLKLTARIKLPGRYKNVGNAMKMGRDALAKKTGAADAWKSIKKQTLAKLKGEKKGLPDEFANAAEQLTETKLELESLSGEEMLNRIADGDAALQEISGVDPDSARQILAMSKKPGGSGVPGEIKKNVVQALEDAPAQAEQQVSRFIENVDESINAIENADSEASLARALEEAETRVSPEKVKQAASADQETYVQKRLEEVLTEPESIPDAAPETTTAPKPQKGKPADGPEPIEKPQPAEAAPPAKKPLKQRWRDSDLTRNEFIELYESNRPKSSTLTKAKLRKKYKEGWRFNPNVKRGKWSKPFGKKKKPKKQKPISSHDDTRALQETARQMEKSHVREWAVDLGADWKVIPNSEFPRWLKKLFPGGNHGPDMVAINPKTKQIIVGDVTTKPNISHLEKLQSDVTRIKNNLPDEYAGFEVKGRERYWEHAVSPEEELPPELLDEMEQQWKQETGEEPIDPEVFREDDIGHDTTLDTPEESPDVPPEKPKKKSED